MEDNEVEADEAKATARGSECGDIVTADNGWLCKRCALAGLEQEEQIRETGGMRGMRIFSFLVFALSTIVLLLTGTLLYSRSLNLAVAMFVLAGILIICMLTVAKKHFGTPLSAALFIGWGTVIVAWVMCWAWTAPNARFLSMLQY